MKRSRRTQIIRTVERWAAAHVLALLDVDSQLYTSLDPDSQEETDLAMATVKRIAATIARARREAEGSK